MITKTWTGPSGGDDMATNPANWTPFGALASGDVLNMGSVGGEIGIVGNALKATSYGAKSVLTVYHTQDGIAANYSVGGPPPNLQPGPTIAVEAALAPVPPPPAITPSAPTPETPPQAPSPPSQEPDSSGAPSVPPPVTRRPRHPRRPRPRQACFRFRPAAASRQRR